MMPFEHIQKAERLEASLRKFDPLDDYEMVIDLCMNAATHYMNAAFHAEGVTHEMQDQGHTNRPPLKLLSTSPGGELQKAMKPLKLIEEMRPRYVRGTEPCESEVMDRCLAWFEEAKRAFLEIAGDAAKAPIWEIR